MNSQLLSRAALVAAPIVTSLGLFAQDTVKVARPIPAAADLKPARVADPVKGFGEVTALTASESAAERTGGRRPHADGAVAQQILAGRPATALGQVFYTQGADGRTWASGDTYKASFGVEGFTYVPFLGARAPQNYPVHFALAAVRVAGKPVAFARGVAPTRDGNRVVFDRGIVREIYDLAAGGIEQTFVVDGAAPGDVTVEMQVHSELAEDATRAGVQFANELGSVDYGTAYVVDGAAKREIASSFEGGLLRLHVPAAERTAGALVIDPVISTSSVSFSTNDFAFPDVAFDASTNRYLVVWQRNFSATDVDVWAEMRDLNGAYVAGSSMQLENSSLWFAKPRVANLNAYNRFLVVAEKYVAANAAGQRYSIWGCTVNANVPFTIGTMVEVSGSEVGDKRDPDVGGDPSLSAPTYWTIAYTRELSATDSDIHARQVMSDGAPRANTLFIENSGSTIYRDVEISHGNGDLGAPAQRWLLVYSYKFGATDWDVYGAALSWDGNVMQASGAIETSSVSHVAPSVSSATSGVAGSPMFGVTFEVDGNGSNDLRGTVVSATLNDIVPTTNLSTLLGVSTTYFSRIETDGCRFVVTYATNLPAYAATLAVVGNSFVVHEAPQVIASADNAFHLNIASRGAAGGANTGYGIVYTDTAPTPDRVVFATYEGHAAGGFSVRSTGCANLGITATGRAVLGRTVIATLTGAGSDLTGMLIGVPGPALTLCSNCVVGVDLAGPMVNLPNVAELNLDIPCLTHLVGSTLTVQGYAAGSGPCFGFLRLGDSLDITIQ